MGKFLAVFFIVAVTATATALIVRSGATPSAAQASPSEALPGMPFWPGESHWSWRVPTPPTTPQGDWVNLRIRETSSELKQGSVLIIGPEAKEPVSAKDAEREFGTGAIGRFSGEAPLPSDVNAAIQLIDLAEVGAESVRPGQPLRVLGKLSIGGGVTKIAGKDIFLPAGRFAGRFVNHNGQTWKNGEFHLMSFLVEGETRCYRYDVVLVHTAEPLAH